MTPLTMVANPARSKSRRPHSLAGGRHLLISLSLLLGQLAAATAAADEAQSKPPPPPSPPPVSPITPSAPTASISTTGNGALLAGSIQPLITATAAAAASPGGKERAAAPIVGQINQEDPVVRLDYSTISDEILRKRTANFVYFNADFSQCRHCGRFFATWKELALDIRWWRQAVRLFTINCSDEDNVEICRRAGVTQLPQVKFYWIMSNSLEQDGQRLRILGKSVHAMRHAIMDKLLESYVDHNKLLAQRAQQRASASAVNPLAGFSTLGPGSATSNSPFTALMPIISRFLSNSKPAGAANGTSMAAAPASAATTSPLGALSASPGTRGGGGGGKSAPGESSVSIMSLVENFGGLQGIIDALMSVASWRRSLTIQPLPSNWPELDAIEVGDTRRLLDMLPLDKARGIGALLIMETSEFLYTGLEVMLDLNPYSNKTYIARVRDERSLLTRNITGRDDLQAPALIYIAETREPQLIMTAPRYTNDEDLRRAFVRAFERKQIKYAVKRVWSAAAGAGGGQQLLPANSSRDDESILERVDDVHMNDLLNTIRSSLTDQVLRHSDLSDDQYNALVKYIYALISYFPFGDEQKPLKFLRRLHTWLQNQVSPLDVSEYKKQLRDMDDESLGARDWIACKSLSSVNSIASDPKRGAGALLFENPAQLGKMVSNLTRLFRSNQQKVTQLKSLLGMLTARGGGASSMPVLLSNLPPNNGGGDNSIQHEQNNIFAPSARLTTTKRPAETKKDSSGDMASSFEKLIKGVTSGSLGSDSSILKLISSALTGGSSSSGAKSGGKSKFAREFPCGAWKLAHVMAVNEYLLDSPRKDVKHIVMHSLYQYMFNFYACATCGNRVSDMAGEFRLNLNEHLIDQGDSIMLLWKLHNRVNKRLEAEIRPGSPPKQQFPSELLCAKCRTSKQQQGDLVSTPNWSQKNVFAFLLHHYRPQTIAPSDDSSSSSDSSSPPSVLLSISLVSFCKIALLFGLTQFLIRPHQ